MRTFDIQPFAGALPITFGMPRAGVHALLGPPDLTRPTWDKSGTSDNWNTACTTVGYDNTGAVIHVGFGPCGEVALLLRGTGLWSEAEHPDPNPALLRLDPAPLERLGFLVFTRLGVTTAGYHDDDESQRAVTVYPSGAWDELLAKATSPDLCRYNHGA